MQEIFIWIKAHWQYVSAGLILIVNLVLFLVKKKPVKVIDSVKALLLAALPSIINRAENYVDIFENRKLSGEEKLSMVINIAKAWLYEEAGLPLQEVECYDGLIQEAVEQILSTPQKKKGD